MSINRYMTFEERFWVRVKKTSGCWIWTGKPDQDGYGRIKRNDHTIGAHKASYIIHYGEVPAGMVVCHKCDNPACVRPDHLFLGTNQDNIADRTRKGRSASGDRNGSRLHPEKRPRGVLHHWITKPFTRLFGSKNGRAKLNDKLAREIRGKFAMGKYTKRALSREYGVSDVQIGKVIRNEIWTGG